jgi:sugar phosphate isomerase/epimerase
MNALDACAPPPETGLYFFVNLPLAWIGRHPGLLGRFLDLGLSPEIGLEGLDLDDPEVEREARRTAGVLRSVGRPHTVHLPFTGIAPAATDPDLARRTRTSLARAVELAGLFEPRRLVGHPYLHRARTPDQIRLAAATAATTWTTALAPWPDHPTLCLENTHEASPGPLAALFGIMDGSRVGACFDVGHWHGFAGGRTGVSLREWVATLSSSLKHVHLHDNDGSGDQHLGLGNGGIDWVEFFGLLEEFRLAPTLTMEPHTEEDCAASLDFARKHRAWFAHPY